MRNLLIIILGSVFIYSCDPDIPGEGITLPAMKFGFKVSPDTAYIKLGDTIILSASIPSTLDNGVKITDGIATISTSITYSENIPIETNIFIPAYKDIYMFIDNEIGDFKTASTGQIIDFYAIPFGDSIKLKFKITPLKTGTYCLGVASKFFEGSQGKTRTQPYFEMSNHNFDKFWKIPEEIYKEGDDVYERGYLFAVYE